MILTSLMTIWLPFLPKVFATLLVFYTTLVVFQFDICENQRPASAPQRRPAMRALVLAAALRAAAPLCEPAFGKVEECLSELKGSVGEGPNQTNYSDRSSV